MSLPLLSRPAAHLCRSRPLPSTSRLTLPAPPITSAHQQWRSSHIGSAPLYLPPHTSLTIQPYPPHPNPVRPLRPALHSARSVLVKGALGEVLLPLHSGLDLSSPSSPAAPQQETAEEKRIRYDVKIQSTGTSAQNKKLVSLWGTTRALLQNALEGVSEGHSVALRLVGVGYRAAVEVDPAPKLSKLEEALRNPNGRTYFISEEQEAAYRSLALLQDQRQGTQQPQRLVLRLGYSHPVIIPVPKGLTVATPQPTRIVVKGVDKELLGLFASKIRAWRPPEPYKGKGVFVGDETITLKVAKKK